MMSNLIVQPCNTSTYHIFLLIYFRYYLATLCNMYQWPPCSTLIYMEWILEWLCSKELNSIIHLSIIDDMKTLLWLYLLHMLLTTTVHVTAMYVWTLDLFITALVNDSMAVFVMNKSSYSGCPTYSTIRDIKIRLFPMISLILPLPMSQLYNRYIPYVIDIGLKYTCYWLNVFVVELTLALFISK
jgi:hypothetical protein